MKVPIEDTSHETPETTQSEACSCDVQGSTCVCDAEHCDCSTEDIDAELDDEEARVQAAIQAGIDAAERELAEEAAKEESAQDDRIAALEAELAQAKEVAAEAQDQLMRLRADWENYRRRTAAERLAEKSLATEKLISNLLPVVDDFERAVEHAQASSVSEVTQFAEGVAAVHTKLMSVLAKEDLEVINPVHEAFDPMAHQAVARVENPELFDETVAEVYQKGYRIGTKIIRNAMVVVSYGGAPRPVETAEDESQSAEGEETSVSEE